MEAAVRHSPLQCLSEDFVVQNKHKPWAKRLRFFLLQFPKASVMLYTQPYIGET
jgi:hypothetical protein